MSTSGRAQVPGSSVNAADRVALLMGAELGWLADGYTSASGASSMPGPLKRGYCRKDYGSVRT